MKNMLLNLICISKYKFFYESAVSCRKHTIHSLLTSSVLKTDPKTTLYCFSCHCSFPIWLFLLRFFTYSALQLTHYCPESTRWTFPKRNAKFFNFNLLLNTLYFIFIDEKIMVTYSVKLLTQNVCLPYLS